MKARALGSFLFLAVVATSSYAGAQDKTRVFVYDISPNWLILKQNTPFRVNVDDQVGDGCWTNTDAVKTAVELEIKRSGFKVVDGI